MNPNLLTGIVVASAASGGLVSYGILLLAFRGLARAAAQSQARVERELERERDRAAAAEERLRSRRRRGAVHHETGPTLRGLDVAPC